MSPQGSDAWAVRLVTPLLGLPQHDEFTVTPLDDTGAVFELVSTAQEPVRVFAVAPESFFPGYGPAVSGEVRSRLGLGDGTPRLLALVTPPAEDGGVPTANLLAPLVVDPSTGQAVQAVLDGDEWPLRAPLG